MEEKERYRWLSPFDDKVLDDKTNNIINAIETLNQQDKKVKKLEQENQQLKQQLVEKEEQLKEELIEKKSLERALSACNRQNDEFADMIKKLVNEKEELEQQLHDLPKNIVGEIRDVVAGGSVNCDNVGGNVTAKGSISMG